MVHKDLDLLSANFSLWTLIFVLYAPEERGHLNYIAIFTQIGASVVASTLLASDKRLFVPTLLILLVPLAIYFILLNEIYGYILSLFHSSCSGFSIMPHTAALGYWRKVTFRPRTIT